MRQFITAGIAVLIVAGHTTCHSGKGVSGLPGTKKQLTRWVNPADSSLAVTLQKDTAGRIVRVEKVGETDEFTFHGDSVQFTEYMASAGRVVYRFSGQLDETGKLISGQALVGYSAHITDTVRHQFIYDETGQLITEYRNYGAGKVYAIRYTHEMGDVVKIETWYNAELVNTKLMEYDRRYRNYTGLEEGRFRSNMNRLTGYSSRHLVKRVTSSGRHGQANYSVTYEYEMDAEGMVLKQVCRKGKKINGVTQYYYTAGA